MIFSRAIPKSAFLSLGLLSLAIGFSQNEVKLCGTMEAMSAFYELHPESKKEAENFEEFTSSYKRSRGAADCFVIPVVFHVYGTTQSGFAVNNTVIANALAIVNNDFHASNSDFNTVHNSFSGVKAGMPDITFALAQFDPSGNPCTGVVYYPTKSGYGNNTGYDAQIAADAWDNYKYMNVYIQNDLYNNSVFNNSGIAWYPNTSMSNNKTARVVYNGAYLGYNTNSEFASVLTHEFGHWLNLIHTFDGGCSGSNDNVSDTPPCDYSGASYGCHASPTSTGPVSCGNLVNAENYMDYSGAAGCYKMFTAGQTTRIYAALQHPARQPLWQPANLLAVGLWTLCSPVGINDQEGLQEDVAYMDLHSNQLYIGKRTQGEEHSYQLNDISGKKILEGSYTALSIQVDLQQIPSGIYLLEFGPEKNKKHLKVVR